MKNRIIVLILILLISIRFWSFQLISDSFYDLLDILVIGCMLFIYLTQKHKIRNGMYLNKYLLWMFFFIFFSTIPAYFIHGQSFVYSMMALRLFGYWLFYYVLHCYNISSKVITKIIVYIAMIWVTILIVQIFTYPNVYFYTKSMLLTGKEVEIRNGIYRLMTFRHNYAMLCAVLFFIKYSIDKKISFLFISLYCLVGLYIYSTRQYLTATILGIVLSVLFLRGKSKYFGIFVSIILIVAIAINFDVLFGETLTKTNDELNEDNLRFLSYTYFLFEFSTSPLAYFFGNGFAHDFSAFGKQITNLNELGLYQSDVGLVGTYSKYGIFYVICVLIIHFKIIFMKLGKDGLYLRIFMIMNFMLLPLSDFFGIASATPLFCIVFYLFDKKYLEMKYQAS